MEYNGKTYELVIQDEEGNVLPCVGCAFWMKEDCNIISDDMKIKHRDNAGNELVWKEVKK